MEQGIARPKGETTARCYTLSQLAEITSVSATNLRDEINRGNLAATKIASSWRVHVDDFNAWWNANAKPNWVSDGVAPAKHPLA